MNDFFFVYNLFPRLYGDIRNWQAPIARANQMGFNWVYINPIHYPGFSGSLYAPKDYYSFNPVFFGDHDRVSAENEFRNWVSFCRKTGVRVMADLVNNHTAKDSVLVDQHPEWYARKKDGTIKSPGAMHAGTFVEWGDLATLDYSNKNKQALWDYICSLIEWFIDLGVDGFRCDAAYQVPADFWTYAINRSKKKNPNVVFWAESLGCEFKEVITLCTCGFDYLMESSKWWDFKADWMIPQHNQLADLAPAVAFPENHDTERLMTEVSGNLDTVKFRYLVSAFMAEGIMITSGFEYGYRKKCDVLNTSPADCETTGIDLVEYIRAVNDLKKANPVLHQRSRITRYDWGVVLGMYKTAGSSSALLLYNRSPKITAVVPVAALTNIMKNFSKARDPFNPITINQGKLILKPEGYHLLLAMNQ